MFEKVKNLIIETLNKDGHAITEDTDLIVDLELNSLEIAELVCAFENEFNIEIPDRDISKFRVIHDIVDYLENSL